MIDSSTNDLVIRGEAHTRLRALLDARGPAALHDREHRLLLDAADALLFDEPDAAAREHEALALLDTLAEGGRWVPEGAAEVRDALRSCGRPVVSAT